MHAGMYPDVPRVFTSYPTEFTIGTVYDVLDRLGDDACNASYNGDTVPLLGQKVLSVC